MSIEHGSYIQQILMMASKDSKTHLLFGRDRRLESNTTREACKEKTTKKQKQRLEMSGKKREKETPYLTPQGALVRL